MLLPRVVFVMLILAIASIGVSSAQCQPVCDNIGTRSEGWYDSCTGELIKLCSCSRCTAICDKIGTREEGWYSSCDGSLIEYDQCGRETTTTATTTTTTTTPTLIPTRTTPTTTTTTTVVPTRVTPTPTTTTTTTPTATPTPTTSETPTPITTTTAPIPVTTTEAPVPTTTVTPISRDVCTDSDDGDIFTKGTTTGWDYYKRKIVSDSDACARYDGGAPKNSGKWVIEIKCDEEGRVHAYYYECPFWCFNGRCVDKNEMQSILEAHRSNATKIRMVVNKTSVGLNYTQLQRYEFKPLSEDLLERIVLKVRSKAQYSFMRKGEDKNIEETVRTHLTSTDFKIIDKFIRKNVTEIVDKGERLKTLDIIEEGDKRVIKLYSERNLNFLGFIPVKIEKYKLLNFTNMKTIKEEVSLWDKIIEVLSTAQETEEEKKCGGFTSLIFSVYEQEIEGYEYGYIKNLDIKIESIDGSYKVSANTGDDGFVSVFLPPPPGEYRYEFELIADPSSDEIYEHDLGKYEPGTWKSAVFNKEKNLKFYGTFELTFENVWTTSESEGCRYDLDIILFTQSIPGKAIGDPCIDSPGLCPSEHYCKPISQIAELYPTYLYRCGGNIIKDLYAKPCNNDNDCKMDCSWSSTPCKESVGLNCYSLWASRPPLCLNGYVVAEEKEYLELKMEKIPEFFCKVLLWADPSEFRDVYKVEKLSTYTYKVTCEQPVEIIREIEGIFSTEWQIPGVVYPTFKINVLTGEIEYLGGANKLYWLGQDPLLSDPETTDLDMGESDYLGVMYVLSNLYETNPYWYYWWEYQN